MKIIKKKKTPKLSMELSLMELPTYWLNEETNLIEYSSQIH